MCWQLSFCVPSLACGLQHPASWWLSCGSLLLPLLSASHMYDMKSSQSFRKISSLSPAIYSPSWSSPLFSAVYFRQFIVVCCCVMCLICQKPFCSVLRWPQRKGWLWKPCTFNTFPLRTLDSDCTFCCLYPYFVLRRVSLDMVQHLFPWNVWIRLLVVGWYCTVRPVLLRYRSSPYTTLIGSDPTGDLWW